MALEPVGVVAVAAVVRPHARLHICDVPRLGAQHPEEREGVHRPGADLGVAALHDGASDGGPVLLEPLDGLLEGERAAPLVSVAGGGVCGGERGRRPVGAGVGRRSRYEETAWAWACAAGGRRRGVGEGGGDVRVSGGGGGGEEGRHGDGGAHARGRGHGNKESKRG